MALLLWIHTGVSSRLECHGNTQLLCRTGTKNIIRSGFVNRLAIFGGPFNMLVHWSDGKLYSNHDYSNAVNVMRTKNKRRLPNYLTTCLPACLPTSFYRLIATTILQ